MKVLDLFAGIGGFSLAAHWMGWETVAFVEREAFCQRVLRKNFGDGIEIHNDIFEFDGRPFRGAVDIVTGGFPCQPFSAAGKRKGRADERHLFPEMLRVISEVRPRWVVAENVRGLLSIENGAVFAEVVTSLESEGYEVITFCIPASAVEAPHRRDRLWIVAFRNRARTIRSIDTDADNPGTGIGLRSERQRAASGQDGRRLAGPEYREKDCNASNGTDTRAFGRFGVETDDAGLDRGRERPDGCPDAPDSEGSNRSRLSEREKAEHSQLGFASCDAPDAGDTRLQGSQFARTSGEGTRASRSVAERFGSDWSERWIDVAARTCVRGVDARLSPELHIVGARDNRVHRLKALGNAVVPQIPYEIFKAIEAADNAE